jgi:hypothetical protein
VASRVPELHRRRVRDVARSAKHDPHQRDDRRFDLQTRAAIADHRAPTPLLRCLQGGVMPQRTPSDPRIDIPPHAAEPLQIETPVIDMQDLEHVANSTTRVSNKGVRIEPTLDAADRRDLAREDEAAIEALEEFEKQIRRQPPT